MMMMTIFFSLTICHGRSRYFRVKIYVPMFYAFVSSCEQMNLGVLGILSQVIYEKAMDNKPFDYSSLDFYFLKTKVMK